MKGTNNMKLKVIKRDDFNNTLLDIYRNSESVDFYMTRKQIGEALGYSNPQNAINGALIRKLSALRETRSDEVQQTDTNNYGGVTYTVPKSWVKVVPPKKMNFTDEQRREMSERMSGINNKRQ